MLFFLIRIPEAFPHTTIDICNQLDGILEDYQGLRSLILGLSTDNVSNMLMVPDFPFLSCIPSLLHSTNLVNGCLFDEDEYTDVMIFVSMSKQKTGSRRIRSTGFLQ